jgi:hypothetical protein
MLKVTVDLVGSDVRRHSDNRDSRAVLSDVHGGRDTIQLRHDDVHEDHVEMITGYACDATVCIRSVLLSIVSSIVLRILFQRIHIQHVRLHIPSTSET